MNIHREGKQFLSGLFFILAIINFLVFYYFEENRIAQAASLIVTVPIYLFFLQFFRNPARNTIINDDHIIAPADGKVVVIEETVETEYFKDKRRQISIFMSPLNVHVNRSPIHGLVKYFKYHPGKYLVAWHPKSSTENERTTLVLQHKNGQDILVRQIAGAVARRIVCYTQKDRQVVQQGGEFGFIKFGSRVDVFLPLDMEIDVKIDQKTRGGETVLAHFKKSN